ncbi:MAG: MCE family protein [Candidatus Omnitrophica bacterium]|nr:MCE family protein [Candidatus Omnitrophota bacterium]
MKKIANEIKTGVMVAICAAILLGLTIKVAGMSAMKKGYKLKAQFNFASAIKKGAPVYLAGVEVGEIKGIDINYTPEGTRVALDAWLESAARVREDSVASIVTMGLMGEKYLELTSGSKDSPFLKEGSLIVGKEPLMMDEVMDRALAITDNLNAGISDLRKLTKDVDLTLTDNRAQVDELIKNMNETGRNFKEFSDDIKRHPWKLLIKGKEKKEDEKPDKKGERR